MIRGLLFIGAGSFLGGVSRFLISRWMQKEFMAVFPWGTLTVNLLGCFLIGLIYGFSEKGGMLSSEWRFFLITGFCGGFTTFSTFTYENLVLLRDGSYFYFSLYAGVSVFVGLLVAFLGIYITKTC